MKLSEFYNILNGLDEKAKKEAMFAIKYSRKSKSKDVYGFGKITDRTFYEAKELQRIFTSDYDASIRKALEFCDKDPEVFKFFAHYNYMRDEVIRLNEIEKALSHYPTADEERAGIDRFTKYGYFGQIRAIAKEFNWTLEYVKDLPYETAFTILLYNKDSYDYDRELAKLRK